MSAPKTNKTTDNIFYRLETRDNEEKKKEEINFSVI